MKFVIYRSYATRQLKSDPALAVPLRPQFRWKLLAGNGKNIANGGESYQRLLPMLKSLRSVFGGSPERVRELHEAYKEYREKYQIPLKADFDFSK